MSAADEVRAMFEDSGDEFATADKTAPCMFTTYDDEVSTDNFSGPVQVVRRSDVLVAAEDFSNLRENDPVTVNGEVYHVLSARLIQDGAVLLVNLQLGEA